MIWNLLSSAGLRNEDLCAPLRNHDLRSQFEARWIDNEASQENFIGRRSLHENWDRQIKARIQAEKENAVAEVGTRKVQAYFLAAIALKRAEYIRKRKGSFPTEFNTYLGSKKHVWRCSSLCCVGEIETYCCFREQFLSQYVSQILRFPCFSFTGGRDIVNVASQVPLCILSSDRWGMRAKFKQIINWVSGICTFFPITFRLIGTPPQH